MNKELIKFLKLNEQLENIVLNCLSSELEMYNMQKGKKQGCFGFHEMDIFPGPK